ncbi:MAG TPA: PorV/PorQ family protein [Candidatus Krumholzibacteria bacterium]|nr:PorV/PorQ family protein [Candidatus Krumholzibacteria bacterium]
MKLRKTLLALAVGAGLSIGVAPAVHAAEIFAKVGTFGAQFLKVGVSARATAMGSAYTAVGDNAEAVYWNPAGIVSVRDSQVMFSQVEWPADINLTYGAFVFNPRSIPGTFAVSGRAVWMDPQIVRTAFEPDGNGEEFDSGMATLGLTYSRFFTDKFSAGLTVNYMNIGLGDFTVNSAFADVGIIYRIGIRGMKIGMSINSLGSEITFDERPARLPTMFKVGFAFEPIRVGNQRVIASSEFSHPVDNAERANFGLEYNMNDVMFLRGGYNLNYDTDGLAAGAGFRVNTGSRSWVNLDYSWVDMDALGNVHRVTMSITY